MLGSEFTSLVMGKRQHFFFMKLVKQVSVKIKADFPNVLPQEVLRQTRRVLSRGGTQPPQLLTFLTYQGIEQVYQ